MKQKNRGKLKKQMLEAMKKSLGNVTKSCEQVGIDRTTHYKWLREDPKYEKRINEVPEEEKDFAENQLRTLMREKNPTATIFFLKTKAKDRGYIEKQELEHSTPKDEKLQLEIVYPNNEQDKNQSDNGQPSGEST